MPIFVVIEDVVTATDDVVRIFGVVLPVFVVIVVGDRSIVVGLLPEPSPSAFWDNAIFLCILFISLFI